MSFKLTVTGVNKFDKTTFSVSVSEASNHSSDDNFEVRI